MLTHDIISRSEPSIEPFVVLLIVHPCLSLSALTNEPSGTGQGQAQQSDLVTGWEFSRHFGNVE